MKKIKLYSLTKDKGTVSGTPVFKSSFFSTIDSYDLLNRMFFVSHTQGLERFEEKIDPDLESSFFEGERDFIKKYNLVIKETEMIEFKHYLKLKDEKRKEAGYLVQLSENLHKVASTKDEINTAQQIYGMALMADNSYESTVEAAKRIIERKKKQSDVI